MLIGGYPFAQLDKTWMYSFEQEHQGWLAGPYLNTGRYGHACGIVKDTGNESMSIVIAAGGYDFGGVKSTEYFVLGTNQWRVGPDLKYRIRDAFGVTAPDEKSFLFVGGRNYDKSQKPEDTIYKLECRNLECTSWTEVDEKLQEGRHSFLAVFLRDSMLGCN